MKKRITDKEAMKILIKLMKENKDILIRLKNEEEKEKKLKKAIDK